MSEPANKAMSRPKVKISPVNSGRLEEYHVSAVPSDPEEGARAQAEGVYGGILEGLKDPASLRIVAERVFGSLEAKEDVLAARETHLNRRRPAAHPVHGAPAASARCGAALRLIVTLRATTDSVPDATRPARAIR
jgi:hypothetical protein